jgi:hypothetical protein
VNGTDYTLVIPSWKSGGRAYFKVQFSVLNAGVTTPTPLNDYIIGYKETTVDGNACATAAVLPIHLYGPFDVDVALANAADALDCPDDTGDPKAPGFTTYQTSIDYLINVVFPDAGSGGYIADSTWTFNFLVEVNGEGAGANATIASITASGGTMIPIVWTPVAGTSSYPASCTIDPSQTTPITFTIVYNDVLGVTQDVSFSIEGIRGAFQEQDIDEVNGTAGNSLTHKIYSMPDVGDILAWN